MLGVCWGVGDEETALLSALCVLGCRRAVGTKDGANFLSSRSLFAVKLLYKLLDAAARWCGVGECDPTKMKTGK